MCARINDLKSFSIQISYSDVHVFSLDLGLCFCSNRVGRAQGGHRAGLLIRCPFPSGLGGEGQFQTFALQDIV